MCSNCVDPHQRIVRWVQGYPFPCNWVGLQVCIILLLLIGANMREYIDDEGIRHTDPLCFDEFGMIDRGVKAIKLLYGITGAVGLIAGLALLFSPNQDPHGSRDHPRHLLHSC